MTKRAFGALLWFMTIWVGYEIAWSVTGMPREIGPVLAAIAATLIAIDPTGRVWGGSKRTQSIMPTHPLISTSVIEVR